MILFTLVAILLSSCYSQKIYLNADKKSGKMVIEYTLTDDTFQLLSMALSNFGDGDVNLDPLILIDEEAFKESMKDTELLKIKFVSVKEINGKYIGKIVAEFSDFQKALDMIPKGIAGLTIQKSKGILTMDQKINYSKMDPDGVFVDYMDQLKDDDTDLYNNLLNNSLFYFEVNSVRPFLHTKGVTLSNKNKKATYSFTIKDLLKKKDKTTEFMLSF